MSRVAERVVEVRERIEDAARRSGRSADEITLVAISKTFSIDMILEALEAGIRDIGENQAQEFAQKAEELSGHDDLNWHFVGHLQRNKAQLVVGRAKLFHALDSERLARRIQKLADREEIDVDCLIQVNVSGEESKFGIEPDDLPQLVEAAVALPRVSIRGLMTLASLTPDKDIVRREFAHLRELHETLPGLGIDRADILSMGMSGDFEIAIEEGATHARVGSAIFGPRLCGVT